MEIKHIVTTTDLQAVHERARLAASITPMLLPLQNVRFTSDNLSYILRTLSYGA